MRRTRAITEKPAMDVVEESMALLRRCPAGVMILYFIGTVPFVLGLLYFWADMSRGAFAGEHVVEASLWLAAAYLWCKCWQSVFGAQLMAVASHRPLRRWTWPMIWRVIVTQSALQPTGLFIVPVAALITLPLGAATAFYQNATVLVLDGMGEALDGKALRQEALREARRWPAQNHVGLGVLSLFGLVVFLNVLILVLIMPALLKSLFGIETMFSRGNFSMMNTTLFAAAGGIAYLCVDPVFKAFYTLRCFNGRSLSTGEDLRVELRTFQGRRFTAASAALLLFFCAGMAMGAVPQSTPRPAEVDTAIAKVLARPEFAWRAPREIEKAEGKSRVESFLEGAGKVIRKWLRPVKRMMERFFRWLDRKMMQRQLSAPSGGGRTNWLGTLRFFAWIFCGVVICVLAVIGWKLWRGRVRPVHLAAQPRQAMPDLESADVTADQLPEDEWLALARQMIEQGNLRLALRALYLAALARLGEREAISIARHKSNFEYQRELARRRPAQGELISAFSSTVRAFERAWYGMHEVTGDIIEASRTDLETIRHAA